MKAKSVSILFIIVVIFLGISFFISKKFINDDDISTTRAKVVTPKGFEDSETPEDSESMSNDFFSENFDTFIELLSSETLIKSLVIDFNNDGYDDEVATIRRSGSENFILIPGKYNPETNNYERLADIPTTVSRTKTFSYTGMDVVGNHQNALVYQGVDNDNNTVMQIFMWKGEETSGELVKIGDFVSDGTVFIEQVDRSDSYERSLSQGKSYSVWVYESEKITDEQGNVVAGQNQIQKEYTWNTLLNEYEVTKEIKVTAGKLAANELSRIQDGTVETFVNFLSGLWYKTSNTGEEIRYIYFDEQKKEIIQLNGDTQEVYEWVTEKLRYNGISFTTTNSDIVNLQRTFDILLSSVDEFKLTIHDSIGLTIKESSVWDGQYKKLSIQSTFEEADKETVNPILAELEKGEVWSTIDGLNSISLKDKEYYFKLDSIEEKGIYSLLEIGTYVVLQFRPMSQETLLNETYAIEFGTKVITENEKTKPVETVVTDYDTIIFTPVKINPTDCFAAEGKIYTFAR